ncbi:MAG: peroxidase-related enzyme [Jatrophihabitans sp.]
MQQRQPNRTDEHAIDLAIDADFDQGSPPGSSPAGHDIHAASARNGGLWWLSLPSVHEPSAELKAEFDASRENAGYVPNQMLTLANKPRQLLASRELVKALMADPDSDLCPFERELIALIVSVENRCDLCIVSHASLLRKITGDPYRIGVIEINYRHADLSRRERALADFAIKITRFPSEVEPGDLDVMRAAGLSDTGILEAASIAAYFNMSNRLMSALGIKAQEQAYRAHRNDPSEV